MFSLEIVVFFVDMMIILSFPRAGQLIFAQKVGKIPLRHQIFVLSY